MAARSDTINWRAHAVVHKFDGPNADRKARLFGLLEPDIEPTGTLAPYEVADAGNNILTTAGLTRITSLLTAGGGQAFTNLACRIGVGDGSTGVLVGDTDLSAAAGSTHRFFEVMAATYPQVSAGVMTFRAVFATGEANFIAGWQEWCVDVGAPTVTTGTTVNAPMLNRKVVNMGVKTVAIAWTFTVTITLA